MRCDDRRDDGEPESDATARAGPRRVDAIEALEDPRGVVVSEAGAVVGDGEPRVLRSRC